MTSDNGPAVNGPAVTSHNCVLDPRKNETLDVVTSKRSWGSVNYLFESGKGFHRRNSLKSSALDPKDSANYVALTVLQIRNRDSFDMTPLVCSLPKDRPHASEPRKLAKPLNFVLFLKVVNLDFLI